MSYFEIKGVIPPVITPFKENGDVDFDAFIHNIEKLNNIPLTGYLILGSNGETPYISYEDKLTLVRLAVKHAAPDKLIMVGTGVESTRHTIELTNAVAELGAHCALILTPNYYGEQMGDDAQISFFETVANAAKIPILIYNVTKFTHVNISPACVTRLSKHPNIIGMKDSSGNIAQLVSFMVSGLDSNFNLIVGTASAWYPALAIGVKAAVMAVANCAPSECVEVQTLFDSGERVSSFELYKKIYPLNACVTGKLGVSALKHACNMRSYHAGYPSAPLLPLTDAQKLQVESIVNTFFG